MRSRYNHSRQRRLPVKAIEYKGGIDVNHKLINNNSYQPGISNRQHCRMNDLTKCIIVLGIVLGILAALLVITIITSITYGPGEF